MDRWVWFISIDDAFLPAGDEGYRANGTELQKRHQGLVYLGEFREECTLPLLSSLLPRSVNVSVDIDNIVAMK